MNRQFLKPFIAAFVCIPAISFAQNSPSQPASTIQSNSNLVVVDVVVTDTQRNPVHKLSKADFTVLENGQPQAIKTFEEHVSNPAAAQLPPLPKLPPGTFTNFSVAPANGALNVLLLDTMNTPMTAQSTVRDQMIKYLKDSPPGTRMAIFGLTTRLLLLQGFTSDPEVLRAALNGKKGLPKGSAVMTDPVNGDSPGADDPMMDMAEDALGDDPSMAQVVADLQQFEAETQSFQLQLRARFTLDAFNQLGRYLSTLPGRKNLIWFSGSFPIDILPDPDLNPANYNQDPFAVMASSADEFRETTELLSRSQVAVYPIDARGLMVEPMLNVTNSGSKYARPATTSNPGNAYAKDQAKFFQQTSDEHGTMQAMAQATGGEAFVNTNGLKQAVEKAVEVGSNYYTLSYTPANQKWNGDYRKIHVDLARSGLNLAYRRGYYADDPNGPPKHGEPPAEVKGQLPAYDAMRAAMTRGGPDPTEIIFVASIRPSSAAQEPDVAPGNKAAAKTKGPYQRFTVELGIDTHDLNCPANPDGSHICTLGAMILVYDADGNVLNSMGGGFRANIPASAFPSLLQNGMHFHQDVSVPVKGEYFFRIGVHDDTTNKLGAVELPVAAVSKLPPLAAKQPNPAAK
jgi:VWFA-related protein